MAAALRPARAPAPSAQRAWLAATRPRTLTASVVPVLAGLALAARAGSFQPLLALATLADALLIQVTVDLANDYFDFRSGVDQHDRLGPPRATGRVLAPERVRRAMLLVLGLAALLGLGLVLAGGWPILAVGVAALLAALAYAGGPRPLGHVGLGEAFVFAFFGPLASAGTFYLQAHAWTAQAVLAGVPAGLVSAAILLVNNIRDAATDARAGKRTLAVRLGAARAWRVYALLLAAAFAPPVLLWRATGSAALLLPLAAAPLALWLARRGPTLRGRALNGLLAQTSLLNAALGLLLAGGLLL